MSGLSPLDLVSKLHQQSVQRDILAMVRQGRSERPIVVELDPTSHCDLACPECISAGVLHSGSFSSERLEEIAHELVELGVRAVILIGGGEPLLHPAISDVMRILSRGGVRVGITTSGTLIHRHLDAIAETASWTRVSVDAASAECYAWVRPSRSGTNAYGRVIGNVRRLASVKTGSLGYSYVLIARGLPNGLQVHNYGEVLSAARLARDLGCDYFEVKAYRDADHFVVPARADLVGLLEEQIAGAMTLACDGFQVVHGSGIGVILGKASAVEPKTYQRCWASELRTLITPSGCYVCPYHRGNPTRRYGDPTTTHFAELWEGAERKQVCLSTRPGRDCPFNCVRHASNIALASITETGQLDGPLISDYDPFL